MNLFLSNYCGHVIVWQPPNVQKKAEFYTFNYTCSLNISEYIGNCVKIFICAMIHYV